MVLIQQLGDAKVGQMRLALRINQDVGGFQVAMDHAVLMREMNRAGHLGQEGGNCDLGLAGRAS